MPTAAAPKGQLVEYALKDESTFGTAPSGNWQNTLAYDDTIEERKPFEDDPVRGTTRHNQRDTTTPAPGLHEGSGTMIVPLCLNHVWFWFKGALGSPSSSGSGDYTHTFASGGEVLPHRSIQKKVASSTWLVNNGMLVDKIGGDSRRQGGYERLTVTFAPFYKQTKFTSSQAGTPPTLLSYDPIAAALPVFRMDGSAVADVLSFRWEYDNKSAINDALGDGEGRIAGHDIDADATFMMTLEMRFRTATQYDQARNGTAFVGELLWQRSATRSLSLMCPVMRLVPSTMKVGAPGRPTQTFEVRAEQSDTEAMLTAVIKNATAAGSYA